jgi:hypothetical protein
MRQTRRIRATVTMGAAAIALTATAGCGTQTARDATKAVSQADTIAAALARVTERTNKIGSAQVAFTTDLGNGRPVTMTGTYSWGKGAAYDVMMDTASAQMQTVQDDPQLRTLMVDGAYYYNVDPQPSGPLKGKHWMRIDVSAVLGEEGARSVEKNADPTAGLRYVGLSKDTEDLGEQTIRGQKAHHYRATIDANESGVFSPEEKKSLLGMATGPVETIIVDLWVDDHDLPVKLVQEVGNVKVSADFLKFGSARTVTAPPASDTADLSDEVKDGQAQQ